MLVGCLPAVIPHGTSNNHHQTKATLMSLPSKHIFQNTRRNWRKQSSRIQHISVPSYHPINWFTTKTLKSRKGLSGKEFLPKPTSNGKVHVRWGKVSVSINHSGWWFQPTPLKNMRKSVGMMKFPIYGKIKNVPNHQSDMYAYIYICIMRLLVIYTLHIV